MTNKQCYKRARFACLSNAHELTLTSAVTGVTAVNASYERASITVNAVMHGHV